MALGITRDLNSVKRFVKEGNVTLYLMECNAAGTALTTGDGTVWTPLGTMKGTKLDANTSEYSDQDDTGADVVNEEKVSSYTITTTLMQRDSATRNFFTNADGKYYLAAIGGASMSTTTNEVHAMAICKVSPKWSYEIGGTAQYEGVTIRTISNSASITVTLPTQLTVATGAQTLTINIGKMHATGDK